MVLNRFSGWLDYPEYYFYWNFHGNNSIFNISSYKNPEMDALIEKARFTADPAEYEKAVKDFIALCIKDVPVVPLNQPFHDVAMPKRFRDINSGSTASRTTGNSRKAERSCRWLLALRPHALARRRDQLTDSNRPAYVSRYSVQPTIWTHESHLLLRA
jgi:ABC-type oligopeptide transport system substrate-binding subunit